MTNEKQVALADERRRFFRIEDLMHLTYREVDEAELERKTALLEKGMVEQFMINSSLAAITADMAATMRKIEVIDPDVASYLKSLDRKIDLVGKAFMADEMSVGDNQAAQVNLSASGIAFDIDKQIPEGTNVEIKMLLMPACTGILTYGKVVGNYPSGTGEDAKNNVRIDFTHLREEDRDMLIRHVIRKQGDLLRERRIARENDTDSL
jgi:hypothetical protein